MSIMPHEPALMTSTRTKLKFSLREKRWESSDGLVYTQPLLVSEAVLGSFFLFPSTKCKGRPCFGLVEGLVHDGPRLDYTRTDERLWFNGREWLGRSKQVYNAAKLVLLLPDGKVYLKEVCNE